MGARRLELVVLGSGASAPARDPRKVRNPAGYAVLAGRETLLFDLGFGNLRQMARGGLDPASVTDVFISHRHPDHVGDLAALLFYYRYERRPRSGRLRVFGPPGFASFLKSWRRSFSPWLDPRGYRLQVRELAEGGGVRGSGWTVGAYRSLHNTESLAYRLEAGNKSLVYSGDTGYDTGLAAFARGCDLFLLECSLGRSERYAWHLNASQALDLIRLSGCRRALLTHLGQAALADVRGMLRASAVPAEPACDLLRVKF